MKPVPPVNSTRLPLSRSSSGSAALAAATASSTNWLIILP
jgi:hypothetical protein